MRPLAILFLLFAPFILAAQISDSLVLTVQDSVNINYTTKLPLKATGFVSYSPPAGAQENFNGISFLNALYTTVPGINMDANPFPQASGFRPMNLISQAVIWDGVPYSFEDFTPFFINGFNVEDISVSGPGGLAGFGPLGVNGGIIVNTKKAGLNDNWRVDLNTYPTFFNYEKDDKTLVLLNNFALSKGIGNTLFRFFYNHGYEPTRKVFQENKITSFDQQGGIALQTGFKKLDFNTNILFQHFKSTYTSSYNEINREALDFTGKAKLTYKLTSWLSLSGLGAMDLNENDFSDQQKHKRFFHQTSIDFKTSISKSLKVFGSISYQNDSTWMYLDWGSDWKYEAETWIGTLGFSLKDFFWSRATFQSNKFSLNRDGFSIYPSFFGGFDFLKALDLKRHPLASGIFRISYCNTYDYPQFLNLIKNRNSYYSLLPFKNSLESGIDFIFSNNKTRLSITHFKDHWKKEERKCDPNSGYCVTTINDVEAFTHSGVEVLVNQTAVSTETIAIRLATGILYSREKFRIDKDWGEGHGRSSIFMNSIFKVKRFFGNALIDLSEGYDNQPVPLREVALGYKLLSAKKSRANSADISFIGKNLITKEEGDFTPFNAYPYYSLNLSVGLR